MQMKHFGIVLLLALSWYSCSRPESENQNPTAQMISMFKKDTTGLSTYWYEGKAEVSRYQLAQNRYKEVHPGEAVLVFVTEDFLTDKQVKNETNQKRNSTSVLKLNAMERFSTGVYDYSLMSSVFSPTDVEKFPHALKITNSNQDWCGQTFMQLNFEKDHFKVESRSYFEKEGDQDFQLPQSWLEQELWTRLRLGPEAIPTGKMMIIPNFSYLRLMHLECKAYSAEASLLPYAGQEFPGEGLKVYRLSYPELNRELDIVFHTQRPYLIEGWMETYPSLFDKIKRSTIAKRSNTLHIAYWQKNSLADRKVREELGMNWLP